eukprot:363363-Chlamydomonas_euryale.AAC.9
MSVAARLSSSRWALHRTTDRRCSPRVRSSWDRRCAYLIVGVAEGLHDAAGAAVWGLWFCSRVPGSVRGGAAEPLTLRC